jgi:hypothetical protein
MNLNFTLLGAATLLISANLAVGQPLPNNFWRNSTFGSGTNMAAADGSGTPTGWVRNGTAPTIDQVTTVNASNATYAIMVNDNDSGNYGEWDSYISLAGLVSAGDTINVQYDQMYSVLGGEMRVTVAFLDVDNNFISLGSVVVSGDSSGWQGSVAASSFDQTNLSLVVPPGAVTLNVGVVSGGSPATTGLLVVDNLYVARAPVPALLAGNIWLNSSFETGTNLDQTNGTPTGWVRAGTDKTICQVTTNNYVSAGHALMVNHSGTVANYGEWDGDFVLPGNAGPGTVLNVQWFELYSVTNGAMRLTFSFLDSAKNTIQSTDFNTSIGQSAGWQGTIEGSGFTKRNVVLLVPSGAVTLRASLVSGGPKTTFGVMLIDDLSVAPALPPPPPTALLTNNFWPNPKFELGSNLDQTNGTPDGWVRAGTDPAICQVITNNFTSPTHALAVIDNETNNFGEWDADLVLSSTNATPLQLVDIQYEALYSITNGPMRVSVLFFDAKTNLLRQTDFNLTGQSVGWQGTTASSTFSVQNQQVLVPPGSVRMRFSLVSGGTALATGVLVIDDLSVAVHPLPPTVLSGNFFPDPTFEAGILLDNSSLGIPSGGWSRGGSSPSMDLVTTNNSVSPTHALELLDNDVNNYGEWYLSSLVQLAGLAAANDVLDIQWFQLYSVTNGTMRLSIAFLSSTGNQLANTDFNTSPGNSSGWAGTVAASSFERQFHRLIVPAGAKQLRANFASGGASSVTGVFVIDDLSIRLTRPVITDVTLDSSGINLTWNSAPGKTYTVLFTSALGGINAWMPLTTNLPPSSADGLTATYVDTTAPAGNQGFYWVKQE